MVPLYLAVALFLVTAIHECGHAVAAWLVGIRVLGIWFGLPVEGWTAKFRLGGLTVGLSPILLVAFCDVHEGEIQTATKSQVLAVASGGMVANLLTAVVLVSVFQIAGGALAPDYQWVILFAALVSLIQVAENILPLVFQGQGTDGKAILEELNRS